MLGVQNRNDMRRASLISEIYSETAGPTGGNIPIGGNSETNVQVRKNSEANIPIGGNSEAKVPIGGNTATAGKVQNVAKTGDQGKKGGNLEKAGISAETLKNHPAFRPKRPYKSGLSKLSKTMNTLF
jgi:hypothetical protein